MQEFDLSHAGWLTIAVLLEIAANIWLKYSDGFRRKFFGILSVVTVLGAFSSLSQAVKGIELSVAYAIWGGFGIIATIIAGWILFEQRLNNKGWTGMVLILTGMLFIKFA